VLEVLPVHAEGEVLAVLGVDGHAVVPILQVEGDHPVPLPSKAAEHLECLEPALDGNAGCVQPAQVDDEAPSPGRLGHQKRWADPPLANRRLNRPGCKVAVPKILPRLPLIR